MAKNTLKASFVLEEEKKGSVRYMEVGLDEALAETPILRTIYVRKDYLGGEPWPEKLTVTIEF